MTSKDCRTALALVAVGYGLMVGCSLLGQRHRSDYYVTAAGHVIYDFGDQGSYPAGLLIRAEVAANLDFRIDEWVRLRAGNNPRGYDAAALRDIAKRVKWYLVDHYKFQSGTSPTGWAAGEYFRNRGAIIASTWTHTVTATAPPAGTPQHTVLYDASKGQYNYGTLSVVDGVARGLDVVAHELDHCVGIDHH